MLRLPLQQPRVTLTQDTEAPCALGEGDREREGGKEDRAWVTDAITKAQLMPTVLHLLAG